MEKGMGVVRGSTLKCETQNCEREVMCVCVCVCVCVNCEGFKYTAA